MSDTYYAILIILMILALFCVMRLRHKYLVLITAQQKHIEAQELTIGELEYHLLVQSKVISTTRLIIGRPKMEQLVEKAQNDMKIECEAEIKARACCDG